MIKHLQNILTQDNLCTSDPVYVVYQKMQVPVPDGYSDYSVMINIEDHEMEMSVKEYDCLSEEYYKWRDSGWKDNRPKFNDENFHIGEWEELHYREVDKFCTACFTRAGAEDYIRANGHNLRKPFIFVESGHRNQEWQDIRAGLINLAEKEKNTDITA